jgi:hypothetical protein
VTLSIVVRARVALDDVGGEVLQLGDARDRQRARGRAERDDHLVVAQLLLPAADRAHAHRAGVRVGAGSSGV